MGWVHDSTDELIDHENRVAENRKRRELREIERRLNARAFVTAARIALMRGGEWQPEKR